MILHAIKQAVKAVCPDFILSRYRDFKRMRYLRKVSEDNQDWINNSFMRGGG